MKNNLKNQRAFTLIETLIYVVIFTIFVGAMVSFGSSMTSGRLHNQIVLEVNDQGSRAMKIMTETLRSAISVNSPTISGSAYNLNIVTNTPSYNPTIFTENGGVLYMTEGSGAPVALTNNKVVISNLIFSNFSRPGTPALIRISFKISNKKIPGNLGGDYSFVLDGSASLRK